MNRRGFFGMIGAAAVGSQVVTGSSTVDEYADLRNSPDNYWRRTGPTLNRQPDLIEAPNYLLWRRREGDALIWTIETQHSGESFIQTTPITLDDYMRGGSYGVDGGYSHRTLARSSMRQDDRGRWIRHLDIEVCRRLRQTFNHHLAFERELDRTTCPPVTAQIMQANTNVMQMCPSSMRDGFTLRPFTINLDPAGRYPNLFALALR